MDDEVRPDLSARYKPQATIRSLSNSLYEHVGMRVTRSFTNWGLDL
jgi:hypothetical protein